MLFLYHVFSYVLQKSRVKLPYGSSKLITNILTLGVGSGGGTSQGVDAKYNDITVTYNSDLTVEQEGALQYNVIVIIAVRCVTIQYYCYNSSKVCYYTILLL